MPQTTRLGKTATTILVDSTSGMTNVCYHNTNVVSFNEKKIILNSNGWRTATTKLRMNQAANQFDLRYVVSQKNGNWYVYNTANGTQYDYKDMMVIKR